MRRKPLVAILVPLYLLAVAGCGGSNRAETRKISGTVTLDGRPLTKGHVLFVPERGRAAKGPIQSDGTYTLGTYGSADGAVLGTHRVAVVCREEAPPIKDKDLGIDISLARRGRSLIPEHYSETATSGLTFKVTPDGPGTFDIQLSRQAAAR